MTYDEFKKLLADIAHRYEVGLLTREEMVSEITMLAMQFGNFE